MSGDHEQEYFSDGITDDLITDLSRLPGLFVIARTSSFTYKGKPAKLQDVGKELGVKYVLQGSVRKSGAQVRITVQLADASSGTELWAERYDRPLQDVFALQDEIVRRIVTTLNLQINLAQQGVVIPRSTESLEAYDDLLHGAEYELSYTKHGNTKARQMLEKAIDLDSKYAMAYAELGSNYLLGWILAFDPNPNGLQQALQMEQQAIALDDSLPLAHSALAGIYTEKGQYDQAVIEAQRCIALDPNSAECYRWLANAFNFQWKPAAALGAVDEAIRLDPRNSFYLFEQGWAYGWLGRWKEASSDLKRFLVRYPNFLWAHSLLCEDYSWLGDEDGVRAETMEVERAVALSPDSAQGYWALAEVLNVQDNPAEALAAVDKAIRLDPSSPYLLLHQGIAYSQLGRWEEAIPILKRHLASNADDYWAHAWLAVDYIEVGHDDAALAEAAEALRVYPPLSAEMMFPPGGVPQKTHPAEIGRFRSDLRKAGLK